jgi:hypothetical protein
MSIGISIAQAALRLSNKMVLADPAQVLVRRSKNSAGMFLAVSCIKISYNPLQHQILDDDLVNFPQGSWREHLGQKFFTRPCGTSLWMRDLVQVRVGSCWRSPAGILVFIFFSQTFPQDLGQNFYVPLGLPSMNSGRTICAMPFIL